VIEPLVYYLKQLEKIDVTKVKCIFDVGARDCLQSIQLSEQFPFAHVYAFEANPQMIPICRENIRNRPRVILIEGAVHSFNGEVDFFPINTQKTVTSWADGNPGASSLFVANSSYPLEKYVQDQIRVNCHRLDDICQQKQIERIDILWMDLQGAELLALKSLGKYLQNTRYIFTEVSFKHIYDGQCLFPEVDEFLSRHSFALQNKLKTHQWQDDAIYKNSAITMV
jgi:FkbM family methyltransferase